MKKKRANEAATSRTAQAQPGSGAASGCAAASKQPTFIASESDTKFELTEEEVNYLDNLLLWQEMSARSTIKLG
jgi:hypothetical protein